MISNKTEKNAEKGHFQDNQAAFLALRSLVLVARMAKLRRRVTASRDKPFPSGDAAPERRR